MEIIHIKLIQTQINFNDAWIINSFLFCNDIVKLQVKPSNGSFKLIKIAILRSDLIPD